MPQITLTITEEQAAAVAEEVARRNAANPDSEPETAESFVLHFVNGGLNGLVQNLQERRHRKAIEALKKLPADKRAKLEKELGLA